MNEFCSHELQHHFRAPRPLARHGYRCRHFALALVRGATLILSSIIIATPAYADCRLVTSGQQVNFGQVSYTSLAPPDSQGLREMTAARMIQISGICDISQTDIHLSFSGLQSVAGKPYISWGGGGAIMFHLDSARVEGVPVTMAVQGGTNSSASGLDLAGDAVVVLDLSRIAPGQRRAFSVRIDMTGALPAAVVLRTALKLDSSFSVNMVDAR